MRGGRQDGAGVAAGREERRLGAADGEHLVVTVERIAGLEIPSGCLIDRREHAERRVAQRSGHLAADDRIDDAARVHRGDHVAVATADAGQGEGSGAFHEERPLLREEDRVALVHLDLERVALDLAEVGVHRGVDGDRRRQPVLPREPHRRVAVVRRPRRRRGALFRAGVDDAGDRLAGRPAAQLIEHQRRVVLEHPLVRLELRPRHRVAGAADTAPEQHAHPRRVAALEADRLERQSDLDGVAGAEDAAGAVPHPVG